MRSLALRAVKPFKSQNKSFMIVSYGLAIVYALVIVVPLYYVFVSSLKDNASIYSAPLALPETLDITNYLRAQDRIDLLQAMGHSLVITAASELTTLAIGFLAAYAIARIQTRVTFVVEMLFGVGFLIPVFALLVPVFLMAASMGLLYNPWFLVVFYAAARLPLTVIVLASYMREIPVDLEEAAQIDGANRLQIMRRIFLPLARSGMATVLVLNFLSIWNEFVFALILLNVNNRTIQLAVPLLRSDRVVDYGLLAAGIMISLIPVYIIFIIFQEQVVSGMLGGSVKA